MANHIVGVGVANSHQSAWGSTALKCPPTIFRREHVVLPWQINWQDWLGRLCGLLKPDSPGSCVQVADEHLEPYVMKPTWSPLCAY